jgi:hypothetical protein
MQHFAPFFETTQFVAIIDPITTAGVLAMNS